MSDQPTNENIIQEIHEDTKVTINEMRTVFEEYSNRDLRREFMSRLFLVIIAGLGLISALAWDEVLREIFFQWLNTDTLGARVGYALIITLIAAFFSVLFGKLVGKTHKK